MMKTIKVNGLGDLYDAAGEILDSLEGRTIVALRGEMGAGKTTLIREICEEAVDFGYEEYFYSGNLCLVEWPEKIEQLMPAEGVMTVLIDVTGDDSRVLRID